MGQKKRSAQNPTSWPDLTQTDQLQTPDLLIWVDTNRQITLREHATYLRPHTCVDQQVAAQHCVLTPFPNPYPRVSPMVKRLYHASFTHCQQILYGKKLRIAWVQVDASDVRKRMAIAFATASASTGGTSGQADHSPSGPCSKRKCLTLRPLRRTSFRASIPILMCASTNREVTLPSLASVFTPSGIIG